MLIAMRRSTRANSAYAPPADDRHHTLPDRGFVDFAADANDFTGQLEAKQGALAKALIAVGAVSLENICAVDACRLHTHQQILGTNLRPRHFGQAENLRRTEAIIDDAFHFACSRVWALARRAMLAANNGVSRRLWSLPAAWRALAASSKEMPCLSRNAMKTSVGCAVTLFV